MPEEGTIIGDYSWLTTLPPPDLSTLEDVRAYLAGDFCKALYCCADLARIKAGARFVEGAPCDLSAIASDIARLKHALAQRKAKEGT
jgi:hypothetical protein